MELINRLVAADLYYFLNDEIISVRIGENKDGTWDIIRQDSETETMYYPYHNEADALADLKSLRNLIMKL